MVGVATARPVRLLTARPFTAAAAATPFILGTTSTRTSYQLTILPTLDKINRRSISRRRRHECSQLVQFLPLISIVDVVVKLSLFARLPDFRNIHRTLHRRHVVRSSSRTGLTGAPNPSPQVISLNTEVFLFRTADTHPVVLLKRLFYVWRFVVEKAPPALVVSQSHFILLFYVSDLLPTVAHQHLFIMSVVVLVVVEIIKSFFRPVVQAFPSVGAELTSDAHLAFHA